MIKGIRPWLSIGQMELFISSKGKKRAALQENAKLLRRSHRDGSIATQQRGCPGTLASQPNEPGRNEAEPA
jgi:hypothetical protein